MVVGCPRPSGVLAPASGVFGPAGRARGERGVAGRIWLSGEVVGAHLRTRRALGRAPIAVVVAKMRGRARSVPAQSPEERLGEARDLASVVVRTLALLPGDTRCLARSLVLTRLMERRGIRATLVIGARAAPDFGAHAWVEHAGHPVLPPGDGSFVRLVEL
jgi:Transglutaminase-like superfamily